MGLTTSDVRFFSFTAQGRFYAETILEWMLGAYEGEALEGLTVLSSNSDLSPHLAHALHAFTLNLKGGWTLCVYRNGGKSFWTVQQACTACFTTKNRAPSSYMSKWESLYSPTESIEILSCGFCHQALATPNTGVYFTLNSEAPTGFEIDVLEEQLVDQGSSHSVLSAVGEADELRRLLRRLITVSDNTVFWAQPNRLNYFLDLPPSGVG